MQEVSRKALPGDFLNSILFFLCFNLARSCYVLCVAAVFDMSAGALCACRAV